MKKKGRLLVLIGFIVFLCLFSSNAFGALIEAQGHIGSGTEIVTITDATSGDSTGTVGIASGGNFGNGRAGITSSGIDLGASAARSGSGNSGGTAIVQDSIGVFDVGNVSSFSGAALKLNLSGSLNGTGLAIVTLHVSDWVMSDGSLAFGVTGQWHLDGGNLHYFNQIANLSENDNWFLSGGSWNYNAPLYVPLEDFVLNSWNQVKISLNVFAMGDASSNFWNTLTFADEDPIQLIDKASGGFLTAQDIGDEFSWDSGAGTVPPPAAVPIPSSLFLLGTGLVGLLKLREKFKK